MDSARVVVQVVLAAATVDVKVVQAHVLVAAAMAVEARVPAAQVRVLAPAVVAADVVAVEDAAGAREVVRAARHAVLVPIYALEGAADPAMQAAIMDVKHPAYRLVIVPVLNLAQVNLHHQLLSIK